MIMMEILLLLLFFVCCQSLGPLTKGNAGEGKKRWNSSEMGRIPGENVWELPESSCALLGSPAAPQSSYWAPSTELGV